MSSQNTTTPLLLTALETEHDESAMNVVVTSLTMLTMTAPVALAWALFVTQQGL